MTLMTQKSQEQRRRDDVALRRQHRPAAGDRRQPRDVVRRVQERGLNLIGPTVTAPRKATQPLVKPISLPKA